MNNEQCVISTMRTVKHDCLAVMIRSVLIQDESVSTSFSGGEGLICIACSCSMKMVQCFASESLSVHRGFRLLLCSAFVGVIIVVWMSLFQHQLAGLFSVRIVPKKVEGSSRPM